MEASTSSAQVFPVNWGIKYLNRFIFSTTRYTVSDEGKAAKAEAQRVPGISKKGSRWNFNSFPKFRKKKMEIQRHRFEDATWKLLGSAPRVKFSQNSQNGWNEERNVGSWNFWIPNRISFNRDFLESCAVLIRESQTITSVLTRGRRQLVKIIRESSISVRFHNYE